MSLFGTVVVDPNSTRVEADSGLPDETGGVSS
jgi:hypothetical protein